MAQQPAWTRERLFEVKHARCAARCGRGPKEEFGAILKRLGYPSPPLVCTESVIRFGFKCAGCGEPSMLLDEVKR